MTEQSWQRHQLAGFWLRVAAVLVDAVVALVAFAALVLLTRPVLETVAGQAPATRMVVGIAVAVLAVGALLYDVLMTAGAGGTLGKRATGLEVRAADGQRIEVGRALARSLARLLSVVVVLLGLVWITWDRRKQGWHDKLAKTVVVKRRHLSLALREPEAPWWAVATPAALSAGPPLAAVEQAPAASAQQVQEMGWSAPASGAGAAPAAAGSAAAAGAWALADDGPVAGPGPSQADAQHAEPEPPATQPLGRPQARDDAAGAAEAAESEDEHAPAVADAADAADEHAPASGDAADAAESEDEHASALGDAADALAVAGGYPGSSQASASAMDAPDAQDASAGASPQAASPYTSAFRELFDDGPEEAPADDAPAGEAEPAAEAARQPQPGWHEPARAGGEATPAAGDAAEGADAPAVTSQGDAPEETDPNLVAVRRAGLAEDAAGWLRQVAAQVDPRLDQVSTAWREQEQAPAARACAFGLLLGHLATLYPHMAEDLHNVAEAHPSFSTLMAGSRLATLQQIAGDRARAAAWLGPLLGVTDETRVARLLQ